MGKLCIVADRGMISGDTVTYLEKEKIPYILGARMRKVKEIRQDVLSRAGRYREVHPEGLSSKDPSPLKVKEVLVDDRRYIVCLNERQASKDAADRQAIIEALRRSSRAIPNRLSATRDTGSTSQWIGIPSLSTNKRSKKRSALTESGCSRPTPIFPPSRWPSSTRSSGRSSRSSGI